MAFTTIQIAALLIAASSTFLGANAHGQIHHVTSNSGSNTGPNVYFAGAAENKKTATRVMYKADSPAYVLSGGFSDNNQMSCEASANAPAPSVLSVSAGSAISIFWEGATSELKSQPGTGGLSSYNPWVHAMGPIQDYITSCGQAGCAKFDATNAGWTKIAAAGLDQGQSLSGELRGTMKGKGGVGEPYYPEGKGLWAMAKMVQQGSKWDVTIPKGLKDGEYVVRHEISAVHSPKTSDPKSGPQVYIACVQIRVTNGGSQSLPAGTQAGKLYEPNGAFANYNVYQGSNPTFAIPGPAIWDGVSSGGDAAPAPTTAAAPTTSKAAVPAPTTTKAVAPVTSAAPAPAPTTSKAVVVEAAPATTSKAATAPAATATRACKPRNKKRALKAKAQHRRRAGARRL